MTSERPLLVTMCEFCGHNEFVIKFGPPPEQKQRMECARCGKAVRDLGSDWMGTLRTRDCGC